MRDPVRKPPRLPAPCPLGYHWQGSVRGDFHAVYFEALEERLRRVRRSLDRVHARTP